MARKPRLHVAGSLYHVILRGNARNAIFFSPEDRRYFYELMAEGVTRFGYRVHAFCLMTNHLHLALQAGDPPLSAGMQNLAFRYTRYLNARRKQVGHVFQGRFKAFLVDQDRYGLALVRYIHLNPVRARMVRAPLAYAYSSHRTYVGQEALPWLTTDWVLGQFGSRIGSARARYTRFIDEGRTQGHNELFYGGQFDPRIVGEEDFVKGVLKSRVRHERPPTLAQVVAYVCRESGMTKAFLLAEGRSRAPAHARALVAWLAIKTKASTLTAVAEHFHRDISTLSHALLRLEQRARSNKSSAHILERHLYAISQA